MADPVYNNVKPDEEIIIKPLQSIRDGNWISGGNGGIFSGLPNIFDSLSFIKKQIIFSFFESSTDWGGGTSGSKTFGVGSLLMQTTTTINTDVQVNDGSAGVENRTSYLSKNPEFSCGLSFGQATNQTIYFGMGDLSPYNTQQGLGFKNINGTIYALSMNGGIESLTEITGLSLFNVYKVKLDSKTQKAYFYVNGILKATHESNIPTQEDDIHINFFMTNTAAANKYIIVTFSLFQQDR